ncbi:hypothetical protein [Natronolimnohabitans innermongolicus]|uniref:MOSC domain-containing protein n=1 Tax=Natronolimnohabitans innermongolicus JCM 12255 TaxID=1227499 RepID=L9WP58_9EURY|nr:hypothetical protein [Natronolimnohabitans innermongolicus]ELY51167.1 hypothetical protein C493_17686 [Natronolimnohabitans innermongolicus JCM 12255]
MSGGDDGTESHSLRGASDRRSLLEFRDVVEGMEPLATAALDDPLNPDELRISLADGIGPASRGRFDVRWSTTNDYNIHYTDDRGRNLRWDVHPHEYPAPDDESHFHPPPDASSDDGAVEASCIDVRQVQLVARATVTLWRTLYDAESLEEPNGVVDPP